MLNTRYSRAYMQHFYPRYEVGGLPKVGIHLFIINFEHGFAKFKASKYAYTLCESRLGLNESRHVDPPFIFHIEKINLPYEVKYWVWCDQQIQEYIHNYTML